jgi:NhaA family Na+:H+ antiporter
MSEGPATDETMEKRAGLLLLAASALALALANSPLAAVYHHLLDWRFGPALPRLGTMSLHQWIADAAMAIFFLLVGLEVKREWIEGRLAGAAERRLPIVAAAAGMAMPALVYLAVTGFDPYFVRGWAIPAATDIAFAIGVLAILGRHAPASIKLLLVTIAIVDDIGAVIVIALGYTADLDVVALGGALALTTVMAALGQFGVRRLSPYLIGFVALWLLVLASGIHPTIAGVLAALTVPLAQGEARSPLKRLEHALHSWVMFLIVPLFGLASAGVSLGGGLGVLAQPLPLGVALGQLIGKQLGVFTAIWAMVRSGFAPMPGGASWRHVHGAALLCGIGFTMSLFITALAFPADPAKVDAAKIGILSGSLLSALAGWAMLRFAKPLPSDADDVEDVGELFAADER